MRRALLAPLALVAALTLGGCDDDPPQPRLESDPTATPSTTAPTQASPSSTATTTPAPEPALTPEETVRAWVEARNTILRTGDDADARKVSSPDCDTCDDQLAPLMKVIEDGGRFETRGWHVVATKVESSTKKSAQITAALELAAGTTFPGKGKPPVSYDKDNRIAVFELTRAEASWLIVFMGFAQ